jgi:Domain of Unknown Function (DUF1080)
MKLTALFLFILLLINNLNAQNKLSRTEKKNGWRLLFDGKTLANWRTYKGAKLNWEVIDGSLHNKNHDASEATRGDLLTVGKFKDFVFSCEWKIASEGNSGIIYRCSEEFKQPYFTGPEYQIIDNECYKGKLTESQKAGANYDMEANTKASPKAVGLWNSTVVLVNGNHVEHWLNGIKVIEYEINSEKWLAQKEKSKWKTAPKYGMEQEGHIDLQDHGHEVWFRNIKVKVL